MTAVSVVPKLRLDTPRSQLRCAYWDPMGRITRAVDARSGSFEKAGHQAELGNQGYPAEPRVTFSPFAVVVVVDVNETAGLLMGLRSGLVYWTLVCLRRRSNGVTTRPARHDRMVNVEGSGTEAAAVAVADEIETLSMAG